MKVLMWIVLANVAGVAALLLASQIGWLSAEDGSDTTAQPISTAGIATRAGEAVTGGDPDLSVPKTLAAYRNEIDTLGRRLEADLDNIHFASGTPGILLYRTATSQSCNTEFAVEAGDESYTRYAEFPFDAITSLASVADDASEPEKNRLRIELKEDATGRGRVMAANPFEEVRLSFGSFFDMPHETPEERTRVKELLESLKYRCAHLAAFEGG